MTAEGLQTERLVLRPLPPAVAVELPDHRETAAHMLGVTIPSDWPQAALRDALPVLAQVAPGEEQFGVWVMIERESRTLVGDIGFLGPPTAEGVIELGYSVIPDRRRRGYATEAASAIVAWALRQPGVRTVVAGCDKDNIASVRTLERLGFTQTGEAEGQLRWRFPAES